jgi:hypothetical protein
MNLKENTFIETFDFSFFSVFLEKHGWKNDGKYNDIFTIWHRTETEYAEYEIIVPEHTNIRYLKQTIGSILNVLADFYKKSVSQIIDDVNNTLRDKVIYQIKSEMTKDGLIPLNERIRVLDNAKEMLAASFLAANKKKKNYIGQRPESIANVLNVIELAQTEEDGFVINIYIPRDYSETGQAPLFNEPSFTRKALGTMELATGALLKKIEEYGQTNDITIFDSCVEKGVSSNLCKAIAEISSNGKSDVVIKIEYNNGIDKESELREITISKEVIPVIKKVDLYYHLDLTEENYEIKGFVTLLHQEHGATEGEVTVATWLEGKRRKVRMKLNAEQYHIALLAHDTRAAIVCRGTLSAQDHIARLLSVTDVLCEGRYEE